MIFMKTLFILLILSGLFIPVIALEDHIQFEPNIYFIYPTQADSEYYFDIANITYKFTRHAITLKYINSNYFFHDQSSEGTRGLFSNTLIRRSHYFEKRIKGYSLSYSNCIYSIFNLVNINIGASIGVLDVWYTERAYITEPHPLDQMIDTTTFLIRQENEWSSNFALMSSIDIGKQFYKYFGIYCFVKGEYYINNDRIKIIRYGIKISI